MSGAALSERRLIGLASLISDRGHAEKVIAGALKSAIDAHGLITVENRSSAAKRVWAALWQAAEDMADA